MKQESSVLPRVAFVALLVAFAFGIGTLWIRAQWPFSVFQALILPAASVCFAAAAWRGRLSVSPWLALPFCIAGIGAVQLALDWTESIRDTRQITLEWWTHACVAVLAFQVCRDQRLRSAALRIFATGAGALALLSTIQNYSAPGRVLWLFDSGFPDLVFGPFTYHTKLAAFAELAIPAACWLAIRDSRARTVYVIATASLAGAVVASASRGGLIVLLLEFCVLAIPAVRNGRQRRTFRPALIIGVAVVLAASASGWELMQHRLTSRNVARDLRLPMMASSIEMSQRYWLTGSGLGTWPMVYPEFARFDTHIRINQAHCDWLQWLVEGGFIMPACMLLAAVATLRSGRREWWGIGVLFVWLHGLIDYPMQQTPALTSLVMAVWGAGLTCRPSHKMTGMEKVVRIFQRREDADEADFRERQSMTPEERVEVFLAIQQRTFRNAADERLARVYRVLTLEQS